MINSKQRLTSTLSGADTGLLPVICPGGMMSMVCQDVGEKSAPDWLEAHKNPSVMARVSLDLQNATGF